MKLKDGLNELSKKVIVITGPTAIGKTDISIEIAKKLNTEIINADSSQFRRGLNIGTAKIDLESIEITHHLIDIIKIDDKFSIKDFQELARTKINELHKNKKIPILVGGSGLYINSVIGDYELDEVTRDVEIEEEMYKDYNNLTLHNLLSELDFESSKKIHPNNRRRVLRAIQRAKDGVKISEAKSGNKLIYDCLIIQLTTPRENLYERINKRFSIMITDGWLDEVKKLKASGYDLANIKDIGYKELSLYLDGEISYEEANEEIKKKTRNYAKRQITWFNNKMDSIKVNVDYENINNTVTEILDIINKFIK